DDVSGADAAIASAHASVSAAHRDLRSPLAGKVCPVGGPNGFIDSWHYPRPGGRLHLGVDMFAAHGTPLHAVADGVVDNVYTDSLGGLAVTMTDTGGDYYYYAHLSSASSRSGQRVRARDVIGAVGNSGNARGTPPHVHWEYHPGGGTPVNPTPLATALCR
ncbi:MAG: M23 family metallopeptidase, partial [Euzebyales bacterium]|nr:M23 family metallopeptidase [Euzebyales bacterium]